MSYAVHYLAGTGELRLVEAASIVSDEAGFRFVSGIRDFVWMAGMDGQLLYFAEHKVFGVYGCALEHAGRPSFWWLFKDCREPEDGYFAKKSWFGRMNNIANMSGAEFAADHLQLQVEMALKYNPDFLKQPVEKVLPKLVGIFHKEMQPYKHALVGLFPETREQVGADGVMEEVFSSFTAILMDESQLVIDGRGYSASQNLECEILERNAEGMVDPRLVTLTECNVDALNNLH